MDLRSFMVLHLACKQVLAPPPHFSICWSFSSFSLSVILSFHDWSSSFKPNLPSSDTLAPQKSWVFSRPLVPLSFWIKLLFTVTFTKFQFINFPGLCPQNFPAVTSFWKQYPDYLLWTSFFALSSDFTSTLRRPNWTSFQALLHKSKSHHWQKAPNLETFIS